MSSLDELRKENARLNAILDGGVRERLLAYPGVFHVAVGVKETAGELTDTLCFRVYVDEKVPESSLPADAVVPPEIEGVPTDVNLRPVRVPTADENAYRPILGGIRITNGHVFVEGGETKLAFGTLGCIGTNRRDGSLVALTNWHVVFCSGGGIGTKIHQPTLALAGGRPTEENVIGIVLDGIVSERADAAVIKVDTSWCRTCGIDWRDEIHGLGLNRYDGIAGLSTAVALEHVFLVGAQAGHRVEGVVVTADEADFSVPYKRVSDSRVTAGDTYTQPFKHQLSIRAAGAEHIGIEGDSGGVIVNSKSEIVGLEFAGNPFDPTGCSASHIGVVISELGKRNIDFDPNFAPIPPPSSPHRGARTLPVPRRPQPDTSAVWTNARRRLEGSPLGARVSAAVEEHRREAVDLVNRCRPVTVAWRRQQGPAFVAHLLKSIREPEHRIPAEVGGATLDGLVERMTETLARHCSPELRAAIDAHGDAVRAAARACGSFDEFAARLAEVGG
jgi:hypothetical protein